MNLSANLYSRIIDNALHDHELALKLFDITSYHRGPKRAQIHQ